MKKIYSVCATIAIVALMSYGIITNFGRFGIVLLILFLCLTSLLTIPYLDSERPDFPTKHAGWMGFLGLVLAMTCTIEVCHTDGQYWLTFAVMIAILSVKPSEATVYFAAVLLGVNMTLIYLNWKTNGFIFYPFFHFGCIVFYTLSTWIRVYIDYKKSLTPKE